MSYVVAIDVGIKNMGICVFDFTTSKIVEWDNVSLVRQGRYIPAHNVQYVRDFVQRYERYFNNAFQILVERQMRCNMRIIEAVLETMFRNCIIIRRLMYLGRGTLASRGAVASQLHRCSATCNQVPRVLPMRRTAVGQ